MILVLITHFYNLKLEMEGKTHSAVAVLRENKGSGVYGSIYFYQKEGENVKVSGEIKGLSKGKHGLYFHEFGKTFRPKLYF